MIKNKNLSLIKSKIVSSTVVMAIALSAIVASPMVFAEGLQLEEITVTARKREESLQEVPISVTSVTEELQSASMQNIQDLQDYTPNIYLERNQGTPGGLNASIRGVQYSETDKSFDPSIGVIVEGMYLGTAAGSMLDNFDVARIEILRGPQGTLFGKNTTGGVINVIRTEPTGEFGGKVSLGLGSNGRQELKGLLNLGLGDTLGLKLFASSIESDGYIRNTTINEDVGGDDRRNFGAAVKWTPTENFDVKLHYERNEDDTDAGVYANANRPQDANCLFFGLVPSLLNPGLTADPRACEQFDTGSGPDTSSSDDRNFSTSEADNLILTANWDAGPVLLTSITTKRDLDQDYLIQFDASPNPFLRFNYFNIWEQTSQELRVTSQFSDTFEFVAGLYYWDVDYDQDWNVFDLFAVVAPLPIGTVGVNGQQQKTESTALFFSGDWHINDQLALTLGGRYTEEEKNFLGGSTQFQFPGAPRPDPRDPATLTAFNDSWSEFSPKIGVTYKPSDDMMMFASYTEGFKSGGFFGRQANFTGPSPTYDPEYVSTYEVGMKSTLMDGRMTFNATAFSSDYEDKQESVLVPITLIDVATVIRNASNLDIWGLELEVAFQATENWKLRGNYGYLNTEYNGYFADVSGDQIATNNDGLTPQNTPANTFGLTSSYDIQLGNGVLGTNVNFRWRDDTEGRVDNNPLAFKKAISNLNLDVTYTFGGDDQFRVSAYGKNLTNDREFYWGTINALNSYRVWTEGDRYGLQFDYKF